MAGSRVNGHIVITRKRRNAIKLLIVTDIEKDFISAKEVFRGDCEWIYRHEQIKRRITGIAVFLPSSRQITDFDSIFIAVLNKGFQIIDMIGG